MFHRGSLLSRCFIWFFFIGTVDAWFELLALKTVHPIVFHMNFDMLLICFVRFSFVRIDLSEVIISKMLALFDLKDIHSLWKLDIFCWWGLFWKGGMLPMIYIHSQQVELRNASFINVLAKKEFIPWLIYPINNSGVCRIQTFAIEHPLTDKTFIVMSWILFFVCNTYQCQKTKGAVISFLEGRRVRHHPMNIKHQII